MLPNTINIIIIMKTYRMAITGAQWRRTIQRQSCTEKN